ncbi:parietopsin [Oryzias melastigma]|uniref:parietopsin n=1 Tax=Oryzias melastigma TaxID=30732 RepID=UPI000CF7C303|nr:parietopsin [Oryzias melastigma]
MRGRSTPAWDSGNVTVWEEYINVGLVVANSLLLLITSFVGIAANSFVILAVYRQKSLQTSVNALVVNLAVVDLLRCTVDCPFLLAIIIAVHQGGRVDGRVCDTQMASFYFSSCLQLLTLACISGERYQAVARPFKESQRKRRLAVLIPLTWTLAVLVAALCLKYLKNSPVYVRCTGPLRGPSSPYDTVGLYMLLPLWAACFAVIIGFYARIFALLRSHNRKIFDEGTSAVKRDPTEGKERARKKKESKVARRAGYIILTFLLFWLPLIATILVNCLIHKNRNTQMLIVQDLDVLSVSVTCTTSLSNPMIYAAVNPQFRSEFYKLKNWIKSKFN